MAEYEGTSWNVRAHSKNELSEVSLKFCLGAGRVCTVSPKGPTSEIQFP
jgi:hypothetical protein